MHFSYELEATLTEEERKADQKLQKYKDELVNPLYSAVVRDFYESRNKVESSTLY
jgi:hypothetical protein